jgi:histone-binding protein RBBP4
VSHFLVLLSDSTIAVWDLRNMSKPISQLLGHTDQVFKLEWSPFNESILGSCSADRRVALWDLSRIGQEISPEDAEDGPPELLFLHGGHTSNVSDFSWNTKDEWSLVSVSEDNVLQIWKPAEEIYAEDDGDDDEKEKAENGDVEDNDLE